MGIAASFRRHRRNPYMAGLPYHHGFGIETVHRVRNPRAQYHIRTGAPQPAAIRPAGPPPITRSRNAKGALVSGLYCFGPTKRQAWRAPSAARRPFPEKRAPMRALVVKSRAKRVPPDQLTPQVQFQRWPCMSATAPPALLTFPERGADIGPCVPASR